MSHKNTHPAHPVRNFFYTLYSLVNLAAFIGFFYAIAVPALPSRFLCIVLSAAVLALALTVGVFLPLRRAKR